MFRGSIFETIQYIGNQQSNMIVIFVCKISCKADVDYPCAEEQTGTSHDAEK
jgi:hypothetical protein